MSGPYLSDYEYHISQLRAHLAGNTNHSLPPSFIPPAGYWTSREKESFFHALSVHSRLRPDLIASAVKSKTIVDVCAYMEALHRAAAAQSLETSSLKSTLKGAMQVSDSWVKYEEEQARILIDMELDWEGKVEEQRRAELLQSHSQDDPTYRSWKEAQESIWGKQDALAQLSVHHLRVLNSLERTGDTTRSRDVALPSSSQPTFEIDDSLIDPVLLALSSAASSSPASQQFPYNSTNPLPPSSQAPSPGPFSQEFPSSPAANPHPPSPDPDPSQLTPTSRRRLAKRLHMRKKRAEAAGKDADTSSRILTPGRKKTKIILSKPRPKNYKPRKPGKWVQKKFELEEEGSAVSYAPPFFPDRQLSSQRDEIEMDADDGEEGTIVEVPEHTNAQAGPSVSDPHSSLQLPGSEMGDEAPTDELPYHSKSGLTAHYRILSAFEDQGIDIDTLVESGLDIFNFSMMAKLMGSFHSAYADPAAKFVTCVSLETIKVLRSILLDFISTTVHHAISLREQEVLLKRKIKVWRLDKEEVTAANIADALQMRGLSKNSLSAEDNEVQSDQDAASDDTSDHLQSEVADDEDNPSLEKRFVEDESNFPARFPLHRENFPLFLPQPKSGDDELMATGTNMEELLEELDEEAELDKQDRQMDTRYEKALWKAVGRKKS